MFSGGKWISMANYDKSKCGIVPTLRNQTVKVYVDKWEENLDAMSQIEIFKMLLLFELLSCKFQLFYTGSRKGSKKAGKLVSLRSSYIVPLRSYPPIEWMSLFGNKMLSLNTDDWIITVDCVNMRSEMQIFCELKIASFQIQ